MEKGCINLLDLYKKCSNEHISITIKVPNNIGPRGRYICIEGEASYQNMRYRVPVLCRCNKLLSLDDIEFSECTDVVNIAINDVLAEIEKQRKELYEANMPTLPPVE